MHTKEELKAELENRFTYHPPTPAQTQQYVQIREKAKELAYLMVDNCPVSRELSSALSNLDFAVFNANAAIARHSS